MKNDRIDCWVVPPKIRVHITTTYIQVEFTHTYILSLFFSGYSICLFGNRVDARWRTIRQDSEAKVFF